MAASDRPSDAFAFMNWATSWATPRSRSQSLTGTQHLTRGASGHWDLDISVTRRARPGRRSCSRPDRHGFARFPLRLSTETILRRRHIVRERGLA